MLPALFPSCNVTQSCFALPTSNLLRSWSPPPREGGGDGKHPSSLLIRSTSDLTATGGGANTKKLRATPVPQTPPVECSVSTPHVNGDFQLFRKRVELLGHIEHPEHNIQPWRRS